MEYLYIKKHIFITLSVYACIKEGILVLKDLCPILLLITLQQSNIFKFNSHQYTHRDPYLISIHKLEYIGVYVIHKYLTPTLTWRQHLEWSFQEWMMSYIFPPPELLHHLTECINILLNWDCVFKGHIKGHFPTMHYSGGQYINQPCDFLFLFKHDQSGRQLYIFGNGLWQIDYGYSRVCPCFWDCPARRPPGTC